MKLSSHNNMAENIPSAFQRYSWIIIPLFLIHNIEEFLNISEYLDLLYANNDNIKFLNFVQGFDHHVLYDTIIIRIIISLFLPVTTWIIWQHNKGSFLAYNILIMVYFYLIVKGIFVVTMFFIAGEYFPGLYTTLLLNLPMGIYMILLLRKDKNIKISSIWILFLHIIIFFLPIMILLWIFGYFLAGLINLI